ncbi:MAG: MFS transporter [Candidatus Kapabacteria bacterium]|jgi:D-galactonate transporter|nr:MFS transporter [Candidatus Kapabacteria bacterium]
MKSTNQTHSPDFIEQTYSKVSWRLIPFLFLLYIVAYLDRVNIGFAQLQMKADLGFSDAVYGLGAGIFFVGYVVFEVPSNLLMERVGARFWIARIMIMWGVVSASMMFVRSEAWFYTLRFLLGIGEAGFAPGIILYITYWYPSERRARVFSRYMIALAISGVIGGPLSGWILTSFAGVNGWTGWQWLFLLEGLPATVLGIIVLFYLDDAPRSAQWLTDDEKNVLESALEQERQAKLAGGHQHNLREALTDSRVLLLGLSYFLMLCGLYGISFWLPQIVRGLGITNPLNIGFLTAALYSAAAVAMLLVSRNSDKTGERRKHIFVCGLVGAMGFVGSGFTSGSPAISLIALTVATCGVLAILPIFWTLPTAFLSGTAAAAGVALINSFGNCGGFAAPYGIGLIKQATGSTDNAMIGLGVVLFLGSALVLVLKGDSRRGER